TVVCSGYIAALLGMTTTSNWMPRSWRALWNARTAVKESVGVGSSAGGTGFRPARELYTRWTAASKASFRLPGCSRTFARMCGARGCQGRECSPVHPGSTAFHFDPLRSDPPPAPVRGTGGIGTGGERGGGIRPIPPAAVRGGAWPIEGHALVYLFQTARTAMG